MKTSTMIKWIYAGLFGTAVNCILSFVFPATQLSEILAWGLVFFLQLGTLKQFEELYIKEVRNG